MFKFILLCCLSVTLVVAKHELYDGHSLYDVNVKFIDQIEFLGHLKQQLNLDVWSDAVPGRSGKILVAREQKQRFQEALQAAGIEFTVEVENIKEQLDLEDALLAASRAKSKSNRSRSGGLSYDEIHSYEVVDAYLEELARNYPQRVTVATAGHSIEGRPIKYIRISSNNFQDGNKPIVMLQSLLHSREWVGLPATLYAIEKLVLDVQEPQLVQDLDWIIVPVVNPDGYVWTHESARFWRKNRARGFMVGDFCMGVDLNRNFDVMWGTASSTNICADDFHGRGPFSEPETAAIRDILREHGHRVELYLDIHSFGSMILYGYGSGQLPPNALGVHVLGVNMAQAIDRVKWPSNPNYIVGNIQMVLYAASGGASDYAMGQGTPFSYTYELPAWRNNAWMNGFLVDPEFIEQAGFETWEGISLAAKFVAENLYRKRSLENL